MAQVPYQPVPDVEPASAPPEDYQRVQSSPEDFGGAIAQGAEKAGAGAVDMAHFWGQVQTEDALNKTLPQLEDNLTKFRQLEGQNALDAQPDFEASQQKILASGRQMLQSPEQQLEFERSATSYAQRLRSIAGSHVADQSKTVVNNINDTAYKVALNRASSFYTQPDMYKSAVADMTAARVKALQARGLATPENLGEASRLAQADAAKAAAESALGQHPDIALKILDANQTALGAEYGPLRIRANEQLTRQGGDDLYQKAAGEVSGGWRGHGATTPVNDPGEQPGYSYEKAAFGHESGGNAGIINNTPYTDAHGVYHPNGSGAAGLFSFMPQTVRDIEARHPELNLHGEWWHDASPAGVAMQKRAFAAFTQDNRDYLQAHGIEPTDKNAFMASFLGAAGATKFIQIAQAHPNEGAAAYFPTEAAANKGNFYNKDGTPKTLAQVYAETTSRFSGKPTIVGGEGSATTAAIPGGATVQPASISTEEILPNAPLPPVQSPHAATPEETRALQIQYVEQSDGTTAEKARAVALINENYRSASIAAMSTAADQKKRFEEASADYTKRVLTGQIGPNIYQEIAADPRLANNGEGMAHVAEFINKWTGKEMKGGFGRQYQDVRARMLSAPDAPNHISDFQDVYRIAADGDLTPAGVNNLFTMKSRIAKDIDARSWDVIADNMLRSANKYLTFSGQGAGPGFTGLRDPKGEEAVETFTPMFMEGFSARMMKAKETGDLKPLQDYLTEKNVREMAEGVRHRRQMDEDRIQAAGGEAGGPDVVPPAPADVGNVGVDSKHWAALMHSAPIVAGKPMSHQAWGRVLMALADNPTPEMAAAFDKSRIGQAVVQDGLNGSSLIETMTGKPLNPLTGKPENVGEPTPASLKGVVPTFERPQGEPPGWRTVREATAPFRNYLWQRLQRPLLPHTDMQGRPIWEEK